DCGETGWQGGEEVLNRQTNENAMNVGPDRQLVNALNSLAPSFASPPSRRRRFGGQSSRFGWLANRSSARLQGAKVGAEGGIRTPTGLLQLAPEASASAVPPLPQVDFSSGQKTQYIRPSAI